MATDAPQPLEFQQVRTRRVFEEICEQIRQRLAAGVLRPGDKLPAERELAQEFKVSRPAVREALRTLEISGVVSLQKGVKGGAFIRDGNPAMLTQSLQDLMFLGRVSLRSLAEARVLIIGSVIKLACERATEEDFRKIEENIDYIESSADLEHRAEAGVLFFRLIAQATRNEVMTMLVDSLGDIVRYVIDKTGRKAFPELVAVRRRILKAMRARDAVAATKAMNEYLGTVHEVIDVEPIALHRPGRAPAAPVPPAAPVKVRGPVAKAVKLPVRAARAPLKKAAR
jgi:GntR family transcriptional regulator, transcriptional repressor for pyruvate dehydrogenase complex